MFTCLRDGGHTGKCAPYANWCGKWIEVAPKPAADVKDTNPKPAQVAVLPDDSAARKGLPLATGCLDYFPLALAAVAAVSKAGNDKHNPGQPLHHARGKSMDHENCIVRHLIDRGTFYEEKLPDGRVIRIRHSAGLAWRALALLQEEIEKDEGAPLPRGAKPTGVR